MSARGAVAAVAALALLSATTYVMQRQPIARGGGSDFRQVAQFIHEHASPGSAFFLDGSGPPTLRPRLAAEGYPALFAGLDDVAFVRSGIGSGSFSDETKPPAEIDWGRVPSVWVAIRVDAPQSAEAIQRVLERDGLHATEKQTIDSTRLTRYARG
jgi:mannosyltransferase